MSIEDNSGTGVSSSDLRRSPPERVIPLPDAGLTTAQAAERTAAGMTNKPVESPGKTVKQIILGNIFTYFNCIFFILAILLLSVGSFKQLTFLVVVAANTAVGIIQELNAKKTLDELNLETEPRSRVVRNGIEITIPSAELVIDDVVIFGSGCRICADAVVMSGAVRVNESFITGESDELTKIPGDPLTSGSYVVSGECRARLDKVGEDSFISQLTLNAKRVKRRRKQGMMLSLSRLVMVIGIILIPLGTAMFFKERFVLGEDIKTSVESTAAALIGMIPEGLYLLTTVALAVSVVRLAKKRTLVHDLGCIETLARVDMLCVDKTGTITENKMTALGAKPLGSASRAEVEGLLCDFCGNMTPDNATMTALQEKYRFPSRRADTVMSFSSVTKYSGVSFISRDGQSESYILGAPEFLMGDDYHMLADEVASLATDGSRVLLFAASDTLPVDGIDTQISITPLALVTLINAVRPHAKETFSYFVEQGVTVKVISGDNPATASAAAIQAGIPGADRYVDASTLSDAKLVEAVRSCTVFGRVTPMQKRTIIRALRRAGHTVAMTGDGVNDILALKEANCSIAMASGSEIACRIAQLVLLDSDFSAMPAVVSEGRRVINNIERTATLYLVKNIFSFALALISIFALFAYPITPSQLSLAGAFIIGIPSFFLSLQPNTARVSGRFLPNVFSRALPPALTDIAMVLSVVIIAPVFRLNDAESSTVSGLLYAVVGMVTLFLVCQPFNRFRAVVWSGTAVLLLLSLIAAGRFFDFTMLGLNAALVFTVLALLTPLVMFLFEHICKLGEKAVRTAIIKLKPIRKR